MPGQEIREGEPTVDNVLPLLKAALPLRCPPIEGESFASAAMRLAEANGLWKTEDLLSGPQTLGSLGFPDHQSSLLLALLSGRTIDSILALAPLPDAPQTPAPDWEGTPTSWTLMGQKLTLQDFALERRACPACVARSKHEPLLWQVSASAGCLEHNLLFVRRCTCGRKLDWSGWVNRCPACGSSVSGLAADPMTESSRAITSYAEGRLRGAAERHVDLLDKIAYSPALRLVQWVGIAVWKPGHETTEQALYSAGFAAICGPKKILLEKVRIAAGNMKYVGGEARLASGNVGRGRLQPALKGLLPKEVEPIADLVREAARG